MITREELAQARARVAEFVSKPPEFESATFLAGIEGAKIAQNGDMKIVVVVPPREKFAALPLTDVVGLQLVFRVTRKRVQAPPEPLFFENDSFDNGDIVVTAATLRAWGTDPDDPDSDSNGDGDDGGP